MQLALASPEQELRDLVGYLQTGIALERQGKIHEALQEYRAGIAQYPNAAELHNNIGNALSRMDRPDLAIKAYRKAATLNPRLAEPVNNIGLILQMNGDTTGAIEHFDRSLSINQDYHPARFNRALSYLLLGEFERAWPDYEVRLQQPGFPVIDLDQPKWDGAGLSGKAIFLYAEQGFGDTFQFVRYAPLVKEKGFRVVLGIPPGLESLLRRCDGIDETIELGPSVSLNIDVQAPLLSLPGLLGTTVDTIPAHIPYIKADAQKVEQWKSRFSEYHLNIGIAWSGNPQHPFNRSRSCPLQHFAKLSTFGYAKFFSLQKGPSAYSQVKNVFWADLIDLDSEIQSFEDTAAIIENLDLIISIDTAVAHLAGAMGKPVWLVLNKIPDWRWLLDRNDSPWYPTMRIFRQQQPNDWDKVFQDIQEALKYLSKEDFQ